MAVSFVKGMQSKAKSLDCVMPKYPTQIASTELIKFIVISCNIQFVLQLHQLSLKYPLSFVCLAAPNQEHLVKRSSVQQAGLTY